MKKKATPKVDWKKFENTLVALAASELQGVGERNPDKRFYGFAFDCNSDYAEVLLSLNTEEGLKEQAHVYATDPPNAAAWAEIDANLSKRLGVEIKPAPRKSAAHYQKTLRWAVGDWKYMGFQSAAFDRGVERFQDAIMDAWLDASGDPNPVSQEFMNVACRAMVRLEKEKAFDVILRTRNFKTWVGDHDESDEKLQERMKLVRRSFLKGQNKKP